MSHEITVQLFNKGRGLTFLDQKLRRSLRALLGFEERRRETLFDCHAYILFSSKTISLIKSISGVVC